MARLGSAISCSAGYLHLDGLLAAAVVDRDNVPRAQHPDELVPIEIPVQLHSGGFHMASAAVVQADGHEEQYTQRRYPLDEMQIFGPPGLRKVNIAAGARKNHRIPRQAVLCDDLTWYAIGDLAEVRELLTFIGYLGKRRGVGLGQVLDWKIEECEPWGEGFPILQNGIPQRHLPQGLPGIGVEDWIIGRLTYPYWDRRDEQVVSRVA